MAVDDAHVFPGFLTPLQLSFQSHQQLFSHASEVRDENTPERKFVSKGYRTHNQQVICRTRPPLSHLGGHLEREREREREREIIWQPG